MGGFGLKMFGSSVSTVVVKFNKNTYYPGDMVMIGIDCDNSKCKNGVKSYKFKLFRQLRCRDSLSGHFDEWETCVHSVKEKGCAGKTKEQKTFNFELPTLEPDSHIDSQPGGTVGRSSKAVSFKDNRKGSRKLHLQGDSDDPDAGPTVDLSPSWLGQVFQVQYMLKVYLKHEGLLEFGAGEFATLPIRILASPKLEPSTEPWRIPADWNPHAPNAEATYIYLQDASVKSEFVTKFLDRNWAKWYENVEPIIMTQEEENRR